jgi:hypothetical protein
MKLQLTPFPNTPVWNKCAKAWIQVEACSRAKRRGTKLGRAAVGTAVAGDQSGIPETKAYGK